MQKFLRDCKGAVTVFVTLLLIPAILVTGTGVDLSRIYAARSMARNANQLALNGALAHYDAMLQDLYGLFAVMQDDEELAAMLDVYIHATLFGEEVSDAQIDAFGRLLLHEGIEFTIHGFDPLSNPQILRRQIEEFAKWRAPVAIVADILERLQGNDAVANDRDAFREYAEIEDQLEGLFDEYHNLVQMMNGLNAYNLVESQSFNNVNSYLGRINAQLVLLRTARERYHDADDEGNYDARDDALANFNAILQNIENIVNGQGQVGRDWQNGAWTDNSQGAGPGLQNTIDANTQRLRDFENMYNNFVQQAQLVDSQRDAARARIDDFIIHLQNNSGSYSPGLADGLIADLDDFRRFLDKDMAALAEEMRTDNMARINAAIAVLDEIPNRGFGRVEGNEVNLSDQASVSFDNLRNAGIQVFDILATHECTGNSCQGDLICSLINASINYTAPQQVRHFRDISPTHAEAYSHLRNLPGISTEAPAGEYDGDENSNSVRRTLREFWEIFEGLTGLENTSLGADQLPGAMWRPATETGQAWNMGFVPDYDGGNYRGFLRSIITLTSSGESFGGIVGQAVGSVVDQGLMVTYANHMFTNISTHKIEGSDTQITMTGHEMGTRINYFYQSELEFLFAGHNTAAENLRSVLWTILAIRLLSNWVASFTINAVRNNIRTTRAAVAAIPIAGKFLAPLVRPVFVFAESVNDLRELKNGRSVPILKTHASQWAFGVTGSQGQAGFSIDLYYRDYMTVFLLMSDPLVVARRMSTLISVNVKNARYNIGACHEAMNVHVQGNGIFDMTQASTGFAATIDDGRVPFMFLSQNFAQDGRFANTPFRFHPITDYRGY